MKKARFFRMLAVSLGLTALLSAGYGCGGKKTSDVGKTDGRLTEFHEQLTTLPGAVQSVTKPILSENGLMVQISELLEIDLTTKKGRKAYRDKANKIAQETEALRRPAAGLLLNAYRLDKPYSDFLQSQEDGFLQEFLDETAEGEDESSVNWPPFAKSPQVTLVRRTVPGQGNELRPGRPRLIGGILVATGVVLAVYKTYSSINEAVNRNNEIVLDTARRSEAGREEVVRLLNKRGADLPKTASDTEIEQAYSEMSNSTRMSVSREVRDFVTDDLAARGGEDGDVAVPILEDDRERYVEAANKLGKVAVESTVDGMMQVTGGAGSAVETLVGGETGKVAGAATDLLLQVTEKDPISLVKEKSIVVATGGREQTTVLAPVNPMTREETEEALEKYAQGKLKETDGDGDKIGDIVGNLLRWHLRDHGIELPLDGSGLNIDAPAKFTVNEVSLKKEPTSDKNAPEFTANFPLRGFLKDAWNYAHLLLSTTGNAPAETDVFINDDSATANMNIVPLGGTISMTATPLEPKTDDSQKFSVSVHLLHHYDQVAVSLDATQAVVSGPRVQYRQPGSGDFSWEVVITGTSRMVARRHDTGESLSQSVKFKSMPGEEEEEDPPGGDVECLDWIRAHSGTYESWAGGYISDCSDGSMRVLYGELTLTISGTDAQLTWHRKERFNCNGLQPEDENYVNYPQASMTVSGNFIYKNDECRLKLDASTATDASLLEEIYDLMEDKAWGSGNTLRPGGDGLIVNARMNSSSYLVCEEDDLFKLRCSGIGACCFGLPEEE